MDIGAYIAASGAIACQKGLETVTHNLTNAATPGYKPWSLEMETLPFAVPADSPAGFDPVAFVHLFPSSRSEQQGELQHTGEPLDLALDGAGYFAVRTSQGVQPTRDGRFRIGPNNALVSPEGYPVVAEDGRDIRIESAGTVEVRSDGEILAGGVAVARLRVAGEDGSPLPDGSFRVLQGQLETSSVKPLEEMMHIMELLRGYQSYMKLMDGFSDMEGKIIQEMGRL
ncbi:MAG: flagellar hook basal-body protein [bacterium]